MAVSRFAEGPDFAQAALLIPTLSAVYGWGYAVQVRHLTPSELIVEAGNYLIRFTQDTHEIVRVQSNISQSICVEPSIWLDPETAVWEEAFPEPRHFRDLIEAFVEIQGDRVYG